MTASPAFLLDVSRLVSRIGTGPLTGIDRVEAAWLAHMADRPHLLLCRVTRGQALLPPAAGPLILRWIAGDLSGLPARPGWRERLARQSGAPALARTALRQMALTVANRDGRGLAAEMQRRLPGAAYLNVGHSNLDRRLLIGLAPLMRVVLIHDTIPLDHPEFTRQGQAPKFRARLMNALNFADLIVTVSQATAENVALWRGRLAVTRRAPIIAAPIGTTLTPPDPSAIPADLPLDRPLFVTLGTIEPRKNHALLLDVWERLARRLSAEKMPRLLILGRRGWENAEVFARLDKLPKDGAVIERAGLPDAAVAALISRSHGLLMPSRAEGFGLPLTEAAGRGIPVLTAPLPSARELLGDYPRYLDADDSAAWADTIAELAAGPAMSLKPIAVSSWSGHFMPIEQAIMSRQNNLTA
ncbi:glycosyltransferase family 4 protein [Paracoccus sp. 12-3]|nr:glycosyltransferase family 4 protein [Paracoccus xiamenensis]